jgi:hypothetical protein
VIIEQLGGAGASATTDDDGRFTLALPRGSYTLRVRGELYQVRRVRNVLVRGGLTSLDVALRLDDLAVEEVVVEAEPDRKSEAANLAERRRSATVQDAVSAQEMSRTPDASAGDAVKRVVSATVVGGRYVFVRGLGGRYSTTLLNGVVLPSPDPDSTAVPLDLFPAALVANLTVVKSYTPDLPGAFAGGDLVIQTNTYPQDFEVKAKVSMSGDSVSTFRDRLDYRGGSTDWLSFDDGTRALPGEVPTDRPLRVGSTGVDAATAERVGEAFQNVWNPTAQSVRPNLGLSAQVGDTLRDQCGRIYGYLATVNYGYKQAVAARRGRRGAPVRGPARHPRAAVERCRHRHRVARRVAQRRRRAHARAQARSAHALHPHRRRSHPGRHRLLGVGQPEHPRSALPVRDPRHELHPAHRSPRPAVGAPAPPRVGGQRRVHRARRARHP